jgi:hypothetical protein
VELHVCACIVRARRLCPTPCLRWTTHGPRRRSRPRRCSRRRCSRARRWRLRSCSSHVRIHAFRALHAHADPHAVYSFARKRSSSRGTAILLLGPSDAGKTAILSSVRRAPSTLSVPQLTRPPARVRPGAPRTHVLADEHGRRRARRQQAAPARRRPGPPAHPRPVRGAPARREGARVRRRREHRLAHRARRS